MVPGQDLQERKLGRFDDSKLSTQLGETIKCLATMVELQKIASKFQYTRTPIVKGRVRMPPSATGYSVFQCFVQGEFGEIGMAVGKSRIYKYPFVFQLLSFPPQLISLPLLR